MTDSQSSPDGPRDKSSRLYPSHQERDAGQKRSELNRLRRDYIEARHEGIRWRQEADQLQEELHAFSRSFGYRHYKIAQLLNYHRKSLLPLSMMGLLCLMFSPLLLVIYVVPGGSRLLLRLARRNATLRELSDLISEYKSASENVTRGQARKKRALILRRPSASRDAFSQLSLAQRRTLLHEQLSPQTRYKIAALGVDSGMTNELTAVRSLDRSEISLQRTSFACNSNINEQV